MWYLRADRRDHRLEQRDALEVVLDRLVDARVLHLHGDALAGLRRRAVHLADARGRERIGLPLGEDLARGAPELFGHHLAPRPRGESGGAFAWSFFRISWNLLLVAGRREPVDVRRHLPELERQALHLAERLEHRLGGLLRALDDLATFFFGRRLASLLADDRALHRLGRHRQRARRERRQAERADRAATSAACRVDRRTSLAVYGTQWRAPSRDSREIRVVPRLQNVQA